MNGSCRIGFLVAAAGLCALASTVEAEVTARWWVNGFGYARIDYTITCADGTRIGPAMDRGFSISGNPACPDGSNSLSYEFGPFWRANVVPVERKRYNTSLQQHFNGNYDPASGTMFVSGLVHLPVSGPRAELAVVLIDPELLPLSLYSAVPMQTLVSNGDIPAHRVMRVWTFAGPGGFTVNEVLELPPNMDMRNISLTLLLETDSCRADFNGDGQVDFFDYLDFVQAYSDENPRADFNGDGQIDFFDYLDFVQAYSEGCE